jgi:hypothetical protein
MELQTRLVDPKNLNKVIGEMATGTPVKRTKASMENGGGTPDLQLSLSSNVGGDSDKHAKMRKILSVALSEQEEVDSDKMLSLSLSRRSGDSGGEGSGGDAGRLLEAATGSSSKKAALGLSTLDLTMSIKALE